MSSLKNTSSFNTSFLRSLSKRQTLPEWDKYPIELDGWTLAHRTIDVDHKRIIETTIAFIAQTEANLPLTTLQKSSFSKYYKSYSEFLHHHHDNEEHIVIPYMVDVKHVKMDGKVSAEHKEIINLLDQCKDLINNKLVTSPTAVEQAATLKEFLDIFKQLESTMTEHFQEEETVTIIDLRKVCTPEEYLHDITLKIVVTMTWEDIGHYYHWLSPEVFKAFAKQEKIPFMVRLILKWYNRKYRNKYVLPLQKATSYAKRM